MRWASGGSVACFLLPEMFEWVEDGVHPMLGADPEDAYAKAICSARLWEAVTAAFRAGPIRFITTAVWDGLHCLHLAA